MNQLRLLRLSVRNFKGLKTCDFEPNGQDVSIYGDNGTFKTTLADAFSWLLFDKNSLGHTDFGIKTLDANGQVIHGLEHEAECVLRLSENTIVLRKVYRERWSKRRGSAKSVFRGNRTDYFVNDVPVKMSEYQQKVGNTLLDEATFRLLTIPGEFGGRLNWRSRRAILMQLCGEIDDQAVLQLNPELDELCSDLESHSAEDLRKIIASRKAKINDQLRAKPIRIDECRSKIDGALDANADAVAEGLALQISDARERIAAQNRLIALVDSGVLISDKVKELRTLEAEAITVRTRVLAKSRDDVLALQNKCQVVSARILEALPNLRMAESGLQEAQERLTKSQVAVETTDSEIERLTEMGPGQVTDKCLSCERPFEPGDIEEAQEQANQSFAERVRLAKENRDQWASVVAFVEKKLIPERTAISEKILESNTNDRAEEFQIREMIRRVESSAPDATNEPEFVQIFAAKVQVEAELASLRDDAGGVRLKHQAELARLQLVETSLVKDAGRLENQKELHERIAELEGEQRALAMSFEDLEHTLHLLDLFTKQKVELLEDGVNERFKLARFKLFDVQVNGALVDCCEVVYLGVPWSDMNHGAKINVGIDIIRTLSGHYGLAPPIWIDNAEAITSILQTDAQQIHLSVSRGDRAMRVELMESTQ